ncbi:MAG: hypothetical protein H6702_22670 [Myxococcales bacterium]|nr:hypothetical protein [Myxococcales bacterium]
MTRTVGALATALLCATAAPVGAQRLVIRERKDWAAVYAEEARQQGVAQRQAAQARWQQRLASVGGQAAPPAAAAQPAAAPATQAPKSVAEKACDALRKTWYERFSRTWFQQLQAVAKAAAYVPDGLSAADQKAWAAADAGTKGRAWLAACRNLNGVEREYVTRWVDAFGVPVEDAASVGNPPGTIPEAVWQAQTNLAQAVKLLPKPSQQGYQQPTLEKGQLRTLVRGRKLYGTEHKMFERRLEYAGKGGVLSAIVDTQFCATATGTEPCVEATYSYKKGSVTEVSVKKGGGKAQRAKILPEALPRFRDPADEPQARSAVVRPMRSVEEAIYRPATTKWSTRPGWRNGSQAGIAQSLARFAPDVPEGDSLRLDLWQYKNVVGNATYNLRRNGRTIFRRKLDDGDFASVTDTYYCDAENPYPCAVKELKWDRQKPPVTSDLSKSDGYCDQITFSQFTPPGMEALEAALNLPKDAAYRPNWPTSADSMRSFTPPAREGFEVDADVAADESRFTVRRDGAVVFQRRVRKTSYGTYMEDTWHCEARGGPCLETYSQYATQSHELGTARSRPL